MQEMSKAYHDIHSFKSDILLIAKEKLDRKEFCKLHKMQESKLSRILNEKVSCSDITFDYICQAIGYELVLFYDVQ